MDIVQAGVPAGTLNVPRQTPLLSVPLTNAPLYEPSTLNDILPENGGLLISPPSHEKNTPPPRTPEPESPTVISTTTDAAPLVTSTDVVETDNPDNHGGSSSIPMTMGVLTTVTSPVKLSPESSRVWFPIRVLDGISTARLTVPLFPTVVEPKKTGSE